MNSKREAYSVKPRQHRVAETAVSSHGHARLRRLIARISLHCLLALSSLTLWSCGGKTASSKDEVTPPPSSPLMAYCMAIDYTDTLRLHDEKETGKITAGIVRLLLDSDTASASEGLEYLFRNLRHDPEALANVAASGYRYLDHPASPVRNETIYIRFLNTLLALDSIPSHIRERERERLRVAMLNRPGEPATDFSYIDRAGKRSTLRQVASPLTLLLFYDPECSHCTHILKYIAASSLLQSAIRSGQIKVIAIYAEGKREVWEKSKNDMPDLWTVGYDLTGILDADLYDLPAMPVIYLLDSEKQVMLKDPDADLFLKELPRLLESVAH